MTPEEAGGREKSAKENGLNIINVFGKLWKGLISVSHPMRIWVVFLLLAPAKI
jgi:hypothetical protein